MFYNEFVKRSVGQPNKKGLVVSQPWLWLLKYHGEAHMTQTQQQKVQIADGTSALGQRSVFCPLPWGRGRRFVPCLGAKVSVLFIAMGQRSVYCSLLWGKGLCIVHCFGAKVSESQCFAPCLGTKVNQCFVFCLGTKVSKFVLFLPWYKDQLGLWVLAR